MNQGNLTVRISVTEQARQAKEASSAWALFTREQKDEALRKIGSQLLQDEAYILSENQKDMQAAKAEQHPASYLDRLLLTPERIKGLVQSLEDLAKLPDPIGEVITEWTLPNGLHIQQTRVPLGVIGMVYEARPNVTIDAAAIALKTGNAIVLRGSRSASHSNQALTRSIRTALEQMNLPHEAVQYLETTDREAVDVLCTLNEYVDVIIPRGGASLISRVVKTSTVPVLETGVGNCHIYIDETASYEMAEAIILNAKTQRPAVCNAAETLLIHEAFARQYGEQLLTSLLDANVQLRACERTLQNHPSLSLVEATATDWDAEFLDLILAVKTVGSLQEAMNHIATHGTKHSEAIITENQANAQLFLRAVDAAAVYHNASTRFTDGGEFGFGAEIGISTQKIHARGPMGLPALTSSKYQIAGNGQIR
ncbi:glutamate-5-semialdehyde dehydrogenase [Brevibacillus dissolubilis]|uniref:glutamate-5-semialdehyde dehydrogenase n=1 Tax=Brevibacillus dissolubilis TaxID=1844116 RepID=UPI001116B7B8|nr:glutamate-5-semialdehyde dehydrogenase [Brevibacillus dissolubilis]